MRPKVCPKCEAHFCNVGEKGCTRCLNLAKNAKKARAAKARRAAKAKGY